ncbi:DM13 domain-containing protein [Halorubellus sp. PRR65]|uniref:DM13 domain-containing protein n=1 Tax=Halorubellus sp. PRR65 TaxID=3098148 RepID=UPI002B25C3A6|nr:DM13 domain-containing protein [Halorubellus sp. PRR65]
MQRRTLLGVLGGATVLGGGGYLGWELFAPERATAENEDRVGGAGESTSADAGGDGSGSDGGGSGSDGGGSGSDGGMDDGTGTDGDAGSGGATVLKRGSFRGKANHECRGTVELARDDAGYFLQFREYEQTQGPDVYCYLTPDPDPDTRADIDAGERIPIDGGADGGEMTKTGTFAQTLPAGVDVDGAMGVGVWCDDFSTPFGAATLEDV